jgi:hypothetical protein
VKRTSLLIALVAVVATGCQHGHTPTNPAELSATERVQVAGRGRERAAYSAYAIALFDLHLSFLELLPGGWFIGSPEFLERTDELAEITQIPRRFDGSLANLSDLNHDISEWRGWYTPRREQLPQSRQAELDPIYEQLAGTTPLLISSEFRDIVRALASMSGIPASWSRSSEPELYADWASFAEDRRAWRDWFETHRQRLEWDVREHRLIIGRGLEPTEG